MFCVGDDLMTYQKIKEEKHSDNYVSFGTWFALKPFYVRVVTTKDVEMCVCKTHLHAHRAVNALVALCKKQEVDLADINDYDSFFASIRSNCPKSDTTYISWDCTEDKKKPCQDNVQDKWERLKSTVLPKSKPDSTVPLSTFLKKPYRTKKGNDIFRLEAETKKVDLGAIVKFIDDMLPNIIHHRNQLKHYRNTVKAAINLFNCIEIDLDFSEKLTVALKYEPQSMHWTNSQLIVHCAMQCIAS